MRSVQILEHLLSDSAEYRRGNLSALVQSGWGVQDDCNCDRRIVYWCKSCKRGDIFGMRIRVRGWIYLLPGTGLARGTVTDQRCAPPGSMRRDHDALHHLSHFGRRE